MFRVFFIFCSQNCICLCKFISRVYPVILLLEDNRKAVRRYMKTEYSTRASSASLMRDVVLLLQSNNPENAQVLEMLTKAKRNYVKERHPRMISQIHSKSKYKDGKWKTYVYVDDKRKVVEANTEEELYTWLYNFYKAQDDA